MSEAKKLYVLYGSQTGNAESIAKDISEILRNSGINHDCLTLNAAKKIVYPSSLCILVVICSTTGNGDAPENADAWWRSVKLRSAPKDMYNGVQFAVLGLGDTNYDKFCHMGKAIDKRLSELGGERFMSLICADEATGLEETIESFKADVITKIKKMFDDEAAPEKLTKLTISDHSNDNSCSIEEKTTSSNTSNTNEECTENRIVPNGVPDGLLSIYQVASLLRIENEILIAPSPSDVLKLKPFKLQDSPFATQKNESIIENTETTKEYTWDTPFLNGKVKSAHWLTKGHSNPNQREGEKNGPEWGSTKRVVHMDISLENSNISYQPGDAIGICCPNPEYLVSAVFERLKSFNGGSSQISSELSLDSVFFTKSSIPITLQEIITYKIDLIGTPRKASIRTLASFCTDEKEKTALLHLCSKSSIGKILWSTFIEAQCIGLGEILILFPSCKPSVQEFFACTSPLPPRYYSIASSPLINPKIASVAFSLVRYTCQIKSPVSAETNLNSISSTAVVKRFGLCTSYLEGLSSSWLYPHSVNSTLKNIEPTSLRLFLKPTITFHMPGSVQNPLILIGPGTGVAPFVGFLQHRMQLEIERNRNRDHICSGMWRGGFELTEDDLPPEYNSVKKFTNAVVPGPIHLFFGCRDHNDFLYENELNAFLQNGTLTSFEVAMSRISSVKRYVTHNIAKRGSELCKLLLDDVASIYVCGDGNTMAKDVYSAFRQILIEHGPMSENEAEVKLQELKLRRRYLMDIWS